MVLPLGTGIPVLKGIAEFPREAMTNRFFWQGIRTDEDALIQAMDVVGDYLVTEYGSRKAKHRAEQDLVLIKGLENSIADPQEKSHALWVLMTTGDDAEVAAILQASPATPT